MPADTVNSSSSSHMSTSQRLPITLIAALSPSNGLGRAGGLPWSLKREMAYFRRATSWVPEEDVRRGRSRNAVIMGRNTWESIPPKFRPLKNRVNYVISRSVGEERQKSLGIDPASDSYLMASLEQAVAHIQSEQRSNISRTFLIGGSQLYSQAMEDMTPQKSSTAILDRLLVTRILEPEFDCDVFLPEYRTQEQKHEDESLLRGEKQSDAGEQKPSTDQQALWTKASSAELGGYLGPDGVEQGPVKEGDVTYEFQMWLARQ